MPDRAIRVAALAMAVALCAMLLALVRPTPLTIGLFLGVGPLAALGSLVVFVRLVLHDLRRRSAL